MAEKTKAEEFALMQKEISVSEFFAKNRHLLGFDNPRKALLMAVKEGVDNSVTYDMPLILRKNGRISVEKIGQIIDEYIEHNNRDIDSMRKGQLERLPIKDNIEVLAYDKKTLKISFRRASTFFRHKVNSKIYRVKLVSGRYVDLTAHHSVFTLDNGKIISVPTSSLKKNMPIIVPRKEWGGSNQKEINLIEEFLLLDPAITSKINLYGINSILTNKVIQDIYNILPRSKKYRLHDFKRFNYLPLNIIRRLNVDIGKLLHSKIGISFCKYKLPAVIEINHNFAEILGLYISEGSMLKSLTRMHFSFGTHEMDLVYYAKDLFEKVFGFSPLVRKAHESACNLIANSTTLCIMFKYILNVGSYASNKKMPNVIFNFSYSLRQSFLLAYLCGDGYPTKELFQLLKNDLPLKDLPVEKITLATASFDLFTSIQYLLSSLGIGYSSGNNKKVSRKINNGLIGNFKESHVIYIYTNNNDTAMNYLPVDATVIAAKDTQIRHSIKRENQINLHIGTIQRGLANDLLVAYAGVEELISGDLGVLRIKDIQEIDYKHKWVYDISVPECENFVSGIGAIVCHNSLDACDEARILPEVYVEVKQLKENKFRVVIEDNGPGIVKEQIPRIFGKLLYGSKFFKLSQKRGQQGIGISAVLLYGQLTTGKGMHIQSKIGPKHNTNYFEVQIDTKKNEPIVAEEKVIEWLNKDHGTRIEFELDGAYQKGKQSVDEYLKETALVNPHATFNYKDPEGKVTTFPRAVNELPKESKEIKPHPYGVEIGILIRMLQSTTSGTLSGFLQNDFCRVSQGVAQQICETAGLNPRARPGTIARDEAEKLYDAIQKTKIIAPPTDCLSPIREEALVRGLKKEINAEFYTAVTRPPNVYRGNPFSIEVSLAFGGSLEKDEPIRLMRFANRVPLLYQQGACSITESVIDTNWRAYGLSQSRDSLPIGPIVLVVHMASVWVPFTSESKEAIANYEEIIKEIKLALQEVGRRLYAYIRKTVRAREQQERVDLFEKYIPELAAALSALSGEKKTELQEKLEKILKKGLKDLLAGVKEAENIEIKGEENSEDAEIQEEQSKINLKKKK